MWQQSLYFKELLFIRLHQICLDMNHCVCVFVFISFHHRWYLLNSFVPFPCSQEKALRVSIPILCFQSQPYSFLPKTMQLHKVCNFQQGNAQGFQFSPLFTHPSNGLWCKQSLLQWQSHNAWHLTPRSARVLGLTADADADAEAVPLWSCDDQPRHVPKIMPK